MAAEDDIIEYLKGNPETFFSRKEIAKRACHRSVFDEDPQWCVQPLHLLVERGEVEKSDSGHYRIQQTGYQSKAKKY
ncbi:MAG: hypothetical protein RLZZ350_2095 [Verrucomicrobiota bacterium]|jgi:hypothetical protein